MVKPLIYQFRREELAGALKAMGMPAFRSRQVWSWLYEHYVSEWGQMTNLPIKMREALSASYELSTGEVIVSTEAGEGTQKLLLKMRAGADVEAVLIPTANRCTICVSCQAGCKFGCVFCASGACGFDRHLEAGEIVAQVLAGTRILGERPTHVVFMGMGEPMDNYDEVMRAVRILNDAEGLRIGARRMTISTCGVVPGIERLAKEGLQVELSVSLHAPDDALRSRLMPVNRAYPLSVLLPACARYADATGRIVTFEYTLVSGINDSAEQARQLVQRLRPCHARVNLIPLSPVENYGGAAPTLDTCRQFQRILEQAGLNTTLRHSKGRALQAACGQLRLRHRQHD